jgi:surface protein
MIGVSQICVAAYRGGGGAPPVNLDFVSTWDTTKAGSASNTVVLPLLSGGTYSGTIDWGDGNSDALSYANRTHVYASSGTYTITISGTIEGWQFAYAGDRLKITDISNWGTFNVVNDRAFDGCSNMTITATDAPTITSTSLNRMFTACSLMNSDIGHWDVSAVTNMQLMFYLCSIFNNGGSDSINNWDVSNVTLMGGINAGMFRSASAFNQPLDNWGVSSVTNMSGMFSQAASFNQNIGGWATTALTNINGMLSYATAFNQALDGWDVSKITDAGNFMFLGGTLSTANYDATLIAWEASLQAAYPGGVGYPYSPTVSFWTSTYTGGGAADAARASLISTFGWTITDGGAV